MRPLQRRTRCPTRVGARPVPCLPLAQVCVEVCTRGRARGSIPVLGVTVYRVDEEVVQARNGEGAVQSEAYRVWIFGIGSRYQRSDVALQRSSAEGRSATATRPRRPSQGRLAVIARIFLVSVHCHVGSIAETASEQIARCRALAKLACQVGGEGLESTRMRAGPAHGRAAVPRGQRLAVTGMQAGQAAVGQALLYQGTLT